MTSLNAAQPQSSVRPKELKPSELVDKENVTNVDETKTHKETNAEITEVTLRQGLFFSSSIGLGWDMAHIQEKLDSEITPVPTYHIEKRMEAKDPHLNLKENLKLELDKKADIDFVVISVGSNDISFLEIKEKNISELITIACNQSRDLVHMADEASKNYNVEKPPRADDASKDPNGFLSLCNISSNGMFHSLITPLEKVHFIPLPSLHNIPEKSKKNLFTDGIHLRHWGQKLVSEDIISSISVERHFKRRWKVLPEGWK